MKPFFIACRPKTLIASISPICIGTALSFSENIFHFWIFICTLITGLSIQIVANLVNDIFDFLKGADTFERKGPLRAVASGLMSVAQMKMATLFMITFTAVFGSILVYHGGFLIALLIPFALLFAIGYTAGPFPLAYLGISELFILIFFGPIASGMTYYLQTKTLSLEAFIVGIAPGLFSCCILVLNNLRDIEEDRKANKKTLVVRFGTSFGKWEYTFSILIGCFVPFLACKNHPLVLLSLLTLIPVIFLVNLVWKNTNALTYNLHFERTGKILTLYTILFSCSLIL